MFKSLSSAVHAAEAENTTLAAVALAAESRDQGRPVEEIRGALRFAMTIDFAAPAMRDDRRRAQLEDPPLGGGFQPMFGEQRLIAVVNGSHAWDVVGENAILPGFRNDRQSNLRIRCQQAGGHLP
jgi:hypothetical protein